MGKENSDSKPVSSWVNYIWRAPARGSNDLEAKCPVDHGQMSINKNADAEVDVEMGACPVDHPLISDMPKDAKCPVDDDARKVWLQQQGQQQPVKHDIECSSDELPTTPIYTTNVKLPDSREVSSIPRTGHGSNWIYPSEKQFYEAMVRKEWNPEAADMKTVVPLHNKVNERVWDYIKSWEENQGGEECGGLKLTSFKGDSKKITPRAWIRSNILGLSKPFDRHDWTVDRCGKEIDYVIDFYSTEDDNANDSTIAPQIYLDVRPKLNSFEGFRLRAMKSLDFGKKDSA